MRYLFTALCLYMYSPFVLSSHPILFNYGGYVLKTSAVVPLFSYYRYYPESYYSPPVDSFFRPPNGTETYSQYIGALSDAISHYNVTAKVYGARCDNESWELYTAQISIIDYEIILQTNGDRIDNDYYSDHNPIDIWSVYVMGKMKFHNTRDSDGHSCYTYLGRWPWNSVFMANNVNDIIAVPLFKFDLSFDDCRATGANCESTQLEILSKWESILASVTGLFSDDPVSFTPSNTGDIAEETVNTDLLKTTGRELSVASSCPVSRTVQVMNNINVELPIATYCALAEILKPYVLGLAFLLSFIFLVR